MSKYIEFEWECDKAKTTVWSIKSIENGDNLGMIAWSNAWRRYCFYPIGQTVFEEICLRDIADFTERKTKEHREKRMADRRAEYV